MFLGSHVQHVLSLEVNFPKFVLKLSGIYCASIDPGFCLW